MFCLLTFYSISFELILCLFGVFVKLLTRTRANMSQENRQHS